MRSSAFAFPTLFFFFVSLLPSFCRGEAAERVWPAPSSSRWYWLKPEPAGKGVDPAAGFEAMAGARMWLRDEQYPAWLMEGEESFYPGPPVSGIALKPGKDGKASGISVETGIVLGGLEHHYDGKPFSFDFKDLKGQELYWSPDSRFEAKWTLRIYASGSHSDMLFTKENHARALAGIISSLASSAGYRQASGLGLETGELSPAQAKDTGKKITGGVLVLSTAAGGPADKAGLRRLDVITHLNGVRIKNKAHFAQLAGKGAAAGKLLFSLLRKGKSGKWEAVKAEISTKLP